MRAFHEILMNVWREVCRHIEISASLAAIAQILARHMPVGQVVIYRFVQAQSHLATTAVSSSGQWTQVKESRTDCTAAQLKRLTAWCRRKEIAHHGDVALRAELASILQQVPEVDVLVGPLDSQCGAAGALLLVADSGQEFQARDISLLEMLLEPFSVAIENDKRLHEMETLRQAVEADKQSLLARLGRKKLGDVIIGANSGLRSVLERVDLAAHLDVPVLVFGETGTGKELIARAIHQRSLRSTGPFIRVNCGAIPPELMDSELFGHERGAFTGAIEMRKGWFERAHGGTLFLDEIGELSLAAQVRLLHVLQDGWMERVGGSEPVNVNVRIVAATHRDLPFAVEEGTFREDLWYRIAVFSILLPPLRDRLEDIPALVKHFAEKASSRFGLAAVLPSDNDIRLLADYDWPGNVRELGAVIDHAAILGNGRRLEIAKALGGVSPRLCASSAPEGGTAPNHGINLAILSLDTVVRRHIEATLSFTKGRIEGVHGAAVLLKINPHTLRARMRKLDIDWGKFRDK